MNKVLREEKKFLIGIHEFISKSHQLQKVLMQDSHNGIHGYMIRSLYFDTPYDTDFFEKQAGTELRRKVKRSLRVSREDAERIIKCDYSPLLKYDEPFAAEIYAFMQSKCYRPCTVVQYNRKAFIAKENKIRVTFDNRIVATESCFDIFSEKLNMNPVLDPYDVVLEVKYNGFLLGYIKEMINSIDKSELSVSKYVLARQNAYQTHI